MRGLSSPPKLLMTRRSFFGGTFASGPLAVVAGALSDFWPAEERGGAIAIFALATFGGPAVGPIVGNFVVQSYLGWRWNAWLTCVSRTGSH